MKRNSNSVVSPCRISFDRDEDGSSALHKEGKHEVDHLQTAERGREWHAPQRAEAIAGTACCKTQCATFCGGLRRLSVRISRVNQSEIRAVTQIGQTVRAIIFLFPERIHASVYEPS